MPDELAELSTESLAERGSGDLLSFLHKFDAESLNLFTECCSLYTDEELGQVLDILEIIKRRNWLYQWAVIAVGGYRAKMRGGGIEDSLKNTFPRLGRSHLYKKFRLWRLFYQDRSVTDRAVWNGESYIFETSTGHSRIPVEIWYMHAMHFTKDEDQAIVALRNAERKYLELEARGLTYTPHQFRIDLMMESGGSIKTVMPPFARFRKVTMNVVGEMRTYLEEFEYEDDLLEVLDQLYQDSAILEREFGAMCGDYSKDELRQMIHQADCSRIRDSKVLDLDLRPLLRGLYGHGGEEE